MDVVRELADRIIVLHNGQLVADGEPADGDRLADGAGGLPAAIAAEGGRSEHEPARTEAACTRTSARTTSCTASTSRCRAARSRCCWAATAPARPRRCARIMGLWHASQGSVRFDGQPTSRRAGQHAARSPQLGIAYVPENMGIFADLTVQARTCCSRRAAPRTSSRWTTQRLEWIFRLFPAVEKFWNSPGRQALGRPEADAGGRRARSSSRANCCSIDEPSKGLAPAIINNMIEAFARAQAQRRRRSCWSSRTSISRSAWATTWR